MPLAQVCPGGHGPASSMRNIHTHFWHFHLTQTLGDTAGTLQELLSRAQTQIILQALGQNNRITNSLRLDKPPCSSPAFRDRHTQLCTGSAWPQSSALPCSLPLLCSVPSPGCLTLLTAHTPVKWWILSVFGWCGALVLWHLCFAVPQLLKLFCSLPA